MIDENVDSFLEHFGVKGQKWGIRNHSLDRVSRVARATKNKEDRIKRLKAGKGSLKDKLIRDLDIHGTRTAIVGPASKKKRLEIGAAGIAMMGIGAVQVNRILKDTGHMHIHK